MIQNKDKKFLWNFQLFGCVDKFTFLGLQESFYKVIKSSHLKLDFSFLTCSETEGRAVSRNVKSPSKRFCNKSPSILGFYYWRMTELTVPFALVVTEQVRRTNLLVTVNWLCPLLDFPENIASADIYRPVTQLFENARRYIAAQT